MSNIIGKPGWWKKTSGLVTVQDRLQDEQDRISYAVGDARRG